MLCRLGGLGCFAEVGLRDTCAYCRLLFHVLCFPLRNKLLLFL